jgi:hypothetical protein
MRKQNGNSAGLTGRNLVMYNEGARHPLRRILPPPTMQLAAIQPQPRWWKSEDTHLFMISFLAFFVVFYTFIA